MPTLQWDSVTRTKDLYNKILQAFNQWHELGTPSPLRNLAQFRALQQSSDATERQITNKMLQAWLEQLTAAKPDHAQILQLRFQKGMPGYAVAQHLNIAQGTVDRWQKEAVRAVAGICQEEEGKRLRAAQAHFAERLDAPFYDCLFGVEGHLQALTAELTAPDTASLILIVGNGGIGKTSLADALMRHAFDQNLFEDYGWISARQQRFQISGTIQTEGESALTAEALIEELARQLLADAPMPIPFSASQVLPILQARLKQIPHLIVVDNLETVDDVEVLLPTLQRLAEPSKFLLTSRKMVQPEVALYPFVVPELSAADAFKLVRHEAAQRNLTHLAAGSDAELRPIYEITGGNPLALRLVIGQSYAHALHDILENLKAARGQATTQLYEYIYRYAWEHLDELSRRALCAMPLIPQSGGSPALLAEISELPLEEISDCLDKLVMLNLIEHHGTLRESCYTIHSLTRSFLHQQVLEWQ